MTKTGSGWAIGPVRVVLAAVTLMAAAVASTAALRSSTIALSEGGRLAVALAPVAVAIWVVAEYVRMIRLSDEFLRRVMLEALAIAFPVAMLIGLAVEYLQKAGFALWADVGRVWPVQALTWALAFAYAQWRYR